MFKMMVMVGLAALLMVASSPAQGASGEDSDLVEAARELKAFREEMGKAPSLKFRDPLDKTEKVFISGIVGMVSERRELTPANRRRRRTVGLCRSSEA